MENGLTFNDLPQVVAELRDEVIGMRQMLTCLQKENTERKENTHRPMSVEDAAEYLKIPLRTLYMKLGNGTIPATNRASGMSSIRTNWTSGWSAIARIPYRMTMEEENAAILASNKRNAIKQKLDNHGNGRKK